MNGKNTGMHDKIFQPIASFFQINFKFIVKVKQSVKNVAI